MRRYKGLHRSNLPGLVLVAVITLIFFSCATNPAPLTEGFDINSSAGFVSFYSKDLGLRITPVLDNGMGETVKNWDWWSRKTDFRIACPPGVQEFIVRHQQYEERFSIPVESGRVTFVGFRRQIDSVDVSTSGSYSTGTTTTTTTTYYVRSSISRMSLPVDSDRLDMESMIAGLSDSDWAIRHYCLKAIIKGDFFDNNADSRLADMVSYQSIEDPIWMVRKEADKLVRRKGLTQPTTPIFFDSFEDEVYGVWKKGEDKGSSFLPSDGGYRITAPKGGAGWSMRDIDFYLGKYLKNRDTFRIVAELSWLKGNDSQAFGLCFGESDEDFIIFCMSGNGGAVSGKYQNGQWDKTLVPWNQAASTEIARRNIHRIEVDKAGNQWGFSVDGVFIAEITNDDWENPGEIGCYVSGPQIVDFRTLAVY